jgi:hypothetical protein
MSLKVMQKLVTKSSTSAATSRFMKSNRLLSALSTNYGLVGRATRNTITMKERRFMSSSSSTETDDNLSVEQLKTSIAGGDYIKLLVADNPYLDVVQYTHRNRFFSVRTIDYNAEALAIGIVENGFIPGDIILSYLPEHLNETVN